MTRVYTSAPLSTNILNTHGGFLLCKHTPIVRCGMQEYHFSELPDNIGLDRHGFVLVECPENEVFQPETIASFEGKTVTLGYPDCTITPENWRTFAHGIVLNVRRGDTGYENLLVCDLLIMTSEAIQRISTEAMKLSCGYDVDYVPNGPGKAIQRNITGKHIALVTSDQLGTHDTIHDADLLSIKETIHIPHTDIVKDSFWQSILWSIKDSNGKALQASSLNKTPKASPTHSETPQVEYMTVIEKLDNLLNVINSIAMRNGWEIPAAIAMQESASNETLGTTYAHFWPTRTPD